MSRTEGTSRQGLTVDGETLHVPDTGFKLSLSTLQVHSHLRVKWQCCSIQ